MTMLPFLEGLKQSTNLVVGLHQAQVSRPSTGENPEGQDVATGYSVVYAALPCYVSETTQTVAVNAGEYYPVTQYTMRYMPDPSINISTNDRIDSVRDATTGAIIYENTAFRVSGFAFKNPVTRLATLEVIGGSSNG